MANRENNINNQSVTDKWQIKDVATDSLVVAVFVLFLTFLRPFGMDEINLAYAGLFWFVICFTGYAIYSPTIFFVSRWLSNKLPTRLNQSPLRLILATTFASLLMGFVSPLIINGFFNSFDSYVNALPLSILASMFIGGIISGVSSIKSVVLQQRASLKQAAAEIELHKDQINSSKQQAQNDFVNLLPIEKRGKLICLQMDDHYLNVTTSNGSHLLLMRFKDALEKLSQFPGLQTHRSWWVALDAVQRTKKDGRKLILVMENGTEVPVSQTYLAKVKQQLSL